MSIHVNCTNDLVAPINTPLFEQAVINLLDNAIKYSEPGMEVEVSAHRSQNEIEIAVRDYGPGIEKSHVDRLFERFYRADKARSRKLGGTGLGLAIVKHIVRLHKCHVGVESTVGDGSVFRSYIPTADC